MEPPKTWARVVGCAHTALTPAVAAARLQRKQGVARAGPLLAPAARSFRRRRRARCPQKTAVALLC